MKVAAASFFSGMLFALGLGISEMTNPNKILAFLDLAGHWDPSLLFVMLGAVTIYFFLFRLFVKRPNPLFAKSWHLPTKKDIDKKLIMGAAIFGVGWGLAGYCPGPALTSLAFGKGEVYLFVIAMIAGGLLYRMVHET